MPVLTSFNFIGMTLYIELYPLFVAQELIMKFLSLLWLDTGSLTNKA